MVEFRVSMTRPDLERAQVQLNCPKCGVTNSVTLGQIRQQATIFCSGCGVRINLKDKNGSMARGLDDINRALDDLERTIRHFGNTYVARI